MQDLIANLPWYLAGAFAIGFVVAWIVCGNPETAAQTALVREDERRRSGALGWLWRGYRAYDRGAGWYDRIGWFLGLFKTNAGVAMLVASTGAAATYGAIEIRKNVIEPLKVETAAIAPEQPEVRQTRNSTVFAIEGKDKAGRRGSFDVVVLNKSFLWVRGSAEDLEKDGTMIPRDQLAAAVLDDEVRGALADAKEVITVGTASQEGDRRRRGGARRAPCQAGGEPRLRRRHRRDADLDAQSRAVPRSVHQLRNRRHELAAAVHRHRREGNRSRHRYWRGAGRRHDRQGEAAEPIELLRLCPQPFPLMATT